MAMAPGLKPGRKKVLAMLRSMPTVHGVDSIHSRVPGTGVTPPPTVAASLNFQPARPIGTTPDRTPTLVVPKRAKL